MPSIKENKMKIDTSKNSQELMDKEKTREIILMLSDVLDGKKLEHIVPALMFLLLASTDHIGMSPDRLVVYFMSALSEHFSNTDDVPVH